MRAAIAHRHAVALHRADRDVGAQRAGRGQQHQRQRVGGHRHQGAGGPQPRDQGAVVAHAAERVGILQQGAEQPFGLERRLGVGHHQADADRLGARAQHRDGLRVAGGIDEERARLGLGQAQAERHRLRRRGRLVQQRGVGDVEAGEVADQGLEVEQRLQPPLRDLRLVRRVGGVPGRVLQDVALDHPGQDRAVIALPDQRGQHAVAAGDLAQPGQHLGLGHARAEAVEPVPGRRRRGGSRRGRSRRSASRGRRHPPRPAWRRYRPRRGRYGARRTNRTAPGCRPKGRSAIASRSNPRRPHGRRSGRFAPLLSVGLRSLSRRRAHLAGRRAATLQKSLPGGPFA